MLLVVVVLVLLGIQVVVVAVELVKLKEERQSFFKVLEVEVVQHQQHLDCINLPIMVCREDLLEQKEMVVEVEEEVVMLLITLLVVPVVALVDIVVMGALERMETQVLVEVLVPVALVVAAAQTPAVVAVAVE